MRRKINNAAANALPQPMAGRVTINNEAPGYGSAILAGVAALVFVFVFLWFVGVFLLDRAGVRHPDEALASGILNLLLIGAIILLSLFIGRYVLAQWLDYLKYQTDIQLEIQRLTVVKAQELPATTGNRMTSKERRFYRAVMTVMTKAYTGMIDTDTGGLLTRSEPWSRRQVGRITLLDETDPIGEHSTLASDVRPWLLEKRILLDDRTVNVAEFPGLAAVQMVLDANFGQPIDFGRGEQIMSNQYTGKAGESWG